MSAGSDNIIERPFEERSSDSIRQPLRHKDENQVSSAKLEEPRPWPLPPKMAAQKRQDAPNNPAVPSDKENLNPEDDDIKASHHRFSNSFPSRKESILAANDQSVRNLRTALARSGSDVSDASSSPSFNSAQEYFLESSTEHDSNPNDQTHPNVNETNENLSTNHLNSTLSSADDQCAHFQVVSSDKESTRLEDNVIFNPGKTSTVLRRPIASAQRDTLMLSQSLEREERSDRVHKDIESAPQTSIFEFSPETITLSDQPLAKHFRRSKTVGRVVMRKQTYESNVTGIRKAEAGIIVGQRDRRLNPVLLQFDNPNPKSLRREAFASVDDEVVSRRISNLFDNLDEEGNKEGKSARRRPVVSRGDGSFLSPGFIDKRIKSNERNRNEKSVLLTRDKNMNEANVDGNPVLRRGASAAFRKVETTSEKNNNIDIVTIGTVHEVVMRTSFICRTYLNYRISVREKGQKIKVESVNDSKHPLRAWVMVTSHPTTRGKCIVNVRPGSINGVTTGIGTMWKFYQSLAKNLQEIEESLE